MTRRVPEQDDIKKVISKQFIRSTEAEAASLVLANKGSKDQACQLDWRLKQLAIHYCPANLIQLSVSIRKDIGLQGNQSVSPKSNA